MFEITEVDLSFTRPTDGDFFAITVPPVPAQILGAMSEARRLGYVLSEIESI